MTMLLHSRRGRSAAELGDKDSVHLTSLLGNPAFNVETPTWKTGDAITGEALTAFQGLHWWIANPSGHIGNNTNTEAAKDDLYVLGRRVRDQMQNLLLAFRVTGDLRLLDTCIMWLETAKDNLAVGYRSHDTGVVTWDASPYLCWVTKGGGQPSDLYGTDLSTMNEVKWHAAIAELTYAMQVNAGATSPAGYDYSSLYAFWLEYLTDHFVPKWAGGGTSGWRNNYRGVRKTPTFNTSGSGSPQRFGRGDEGQWPLVVNGGDLHSTQSGAVLHYYLGLLLGDSDAISESLWVTERFLDTDSVMVGEARIWGHQATSHGSPETSVQGSTYTPFTLADYAEMYLEGGHPSVTASLLSQMTQAVRQHTLRTGVTSNTQSVSLTYPYLSGTSPSGGYTTLSGQSDQTQGQVVLNPWFVTAAIVGDEILIDEARRLLTDKPWAGTLAQPSSSSPNAAILLSHAPLHGGV